MASSVAYKRPGTYAEETLVTQQPGVGPGTNFVSAFIGTNNRGPTAPTYVRSWTEFVSNYGGFSADSVLPVNVFFYFANGGRGAYISRVIHVDSTVASFTVADGGSSAHNVLSVKAANEGDWGNGLHVSTTRKATGITSPFSLYVYYGGATADAIVERYDNLSMDPTNVRYAPNIINVQAGRGGSRYIFVEEAEENLATHNSPVTTTATDGHLTGGADGAASVDHPLAQDWERCRTGLDVLDGPMQVSCAGLYSTTSGSSHEQDFAILNATLNWAASRGDVWVVVDPEPGRLPADVLVDAAQLNSTTYGAMYYPWIMVADPSAVTPGITRLIPPGPVVLGIAERTDAVRGPFKAPAGYGARVLGAIALERRLTSSDLDSLNTGTSPVNALRSIPGAGTVVMGARTLAQGNAAQYVPNRRSLIYLATSLEKITQFAVFEPNDYHLWNTLQNVCSRFLTGYWQTGGLVGLKPSDAYFVICDSSNNTPDVTNAGEVRIDVGVALTNPAEFVIIRIGQTVAGATTTEAV